MASYRFNKFCKLAKLKKGQKILDVGCGRGEIIIQCALKGIDGLGVDYSADGIGLCNKIKKGFPEKIRKHMKFLKEDIKEIKLPDEYFDRVFMLDVVEHLHDWELEKSLEKIRKLMKKNGMFIIHTTPNTDFYRYGYPIIRFMYPVLSLIVPSIKKLIDTKPNWKNKRFLPKDPEEGQRYDKGGHINEMNPRRLKKVLKRAGFHPKIILVPFTRDIKGPLLNAVYLALSLPLIKNIFCAEIIAVCKT